ncbi:MAG: sulfatase [Candidatus Hydrogenedentota bacterium]
MNRRDFLGSVAVGTAASVFTRSASAKAQPNVVFVFSDQWRAQATGYAGDPNVKTPHLDRLAASSLNLCNAISGWPVCSPYRGSLLTGQYPHTHGVFLNDVPLNPDATSVADVFSAEGYATGYIGKWHVNGQGRSNFIPRERRQGFDYWKVLECTHNYNASDYFADRNELLRWEGYDAIAQTRDAQAYIRDHAGKEPFALFLSWGPPHNPYETAPSQYKDLYKPEDLVLRPNVPSDHEAGSRVDLAGYYAHCSALDQCAGDIWQTLRETGIEDNTIFVVTSDHGDMLGSQGQKRKQRPWDESIRVPFLLHYPTRFGQIERKVDALINSLDLMPTLLGLCGLNIPDSVEGTDFTPYLTGEMQTTDDDAALLACYSPFGEWTRAQGGREFRGVRTRRHTYIRALEGPWLLYDNETDPHQLENLCNKPEIKEEQARLEGILQAKLAMAKDEFLPGSEYISKWGYVTDANGTVPYRG